ncbi:methyltransferase domain containing protein, putative [Leishmania tarentolae]|uniref:tRNA:m(4)X modification enzyme TRM13 n=1 Tax=Leishmania tarentolae TaxID=5689 RepID=A0A640KH72_LEITA|nr:methyltransferase domain containing protein, putative [Leishmania tarentolae]
MLNYRCKQRQYHSVLWSLQFVLALLHHSRNDTARERQPPREDEDTREGDRCRVSTSTGATDTESSTLIAFQAAADGALDSFDAQGPLSASQLLSLQDSLTDAQVRDLCVQCMRHFITQQQAPALTSLQQPLFSAENVFAAPTSLLRVLWPTESILQHYTRALEVAHHQRIDHSDLLAMPGYLQEAGLHARCVFATSSGTTHDEQSVMAHASEQRAANEWARLIDLYTSFLPDRSHIHELENLPQEIAIGELLRETVERVRRADDEANGNGFALDCVVDVGGGNGFLAAQVAERLQCDSVVIDPFFPAHSIDCCPRVWPDTVQRTRPATRRQRTLHRTMALFRDVRWFDAVPAAPARTALIAKHLCGSGVDEVLRHLEAQKCLPRILVLAPCCFNKCSLDTYIDPEFVSALLGLNSAETFSHLTRLTDWNASVYQRLQGVALSRTAPSASTSKKSVRYFVSCPGGIAASVEAVVTQGRVQWLQRHGYVVQLAEYVPDCVTPKNRCMVAYRP